VCPFHLLLPLYADIRWPKIVVSINNRIAAWSLSGVHRDTWRVHSSLVLPDDHCVTTLDCKSGDLGAPYSIVDSSPDLLFRTARCWQ
jgi:hypothetical protein